MTRVLKTFDEMMSLYPAWVALWEKDPLCTVFSHPAWCLSYVRSHNENLFMVVVWEEDGSLNMVWPLEQKGKTLTFLSDPRPDYSRPAVAPLLDPAAVAEAFLDACECELKDKHLVLQDFCSEDPLPAAIFAASVRRGYSPFLAKGYPTARLVLRPDADARSINIVKSNTLRQSDSKLKKKGAAFKRLQDKNELDAALPAFFVLHTARWAGHGETIFLDRRIRTFYLQVLRQLPEQMVSVFQLQLDGDIIAMDVDFISKGTYFYYKPAFNPDYAKLSPGLVLLRHIVDGMAGSLHTLDFGRGLESYKKRFATEVSLNQSVVVCPGFVSKGIWLLGFRLREHFGRSTRIGGYVRRFLDKVKAVRDKYGIIGMLRHAGCKAWRGLFSRPPLLMFEFPESLPEEPSLPDGLSLREGGRNDLFDVADLVNPLDKAGHIARMLERLKVGERVFLVFSDGVLVHTSWVSERDTVRLCEIGRDYTIGPGNAYIFDCFTAPALRGRGIYPAVLARLIWELLHAKRNPRVFIACLKDNLASVRGIEKAGFLFKERLARK